MLTFLSLQGEDYSSFISARLCCFFVVVWRFGKSSESEVVEVEMEVEGCAP